MLVFLTILQKDVQMWLEKWQYLWNTFIRGLFWKKQLAFWFLWVCIHQKYFWNSSFHCYIAQVLQNKFSHLCKNSHCFSRTASASQLTPDALLPVRKDENISQEWQPLAFPEPQPHHQPHSYHRTCWLCTVLGMMGGSWQIDRNVRVSLAPKPGIGRAAGWTVHGL